jgi:hypothetical protein
MSVRSECYFQDMVLGPMEFSAACWAGIDSQVYAVHSCDMSAIRHCIGTLMHGKDDKL